jgi:putative inorganic carbon (HCO3(-)) transporter
MKGLIFTYALAYGGSAVALLNPFVGLLIYICFAIIKPESLWFWSVPEGNYSRTIAIALLLGWIGKGLGDWRLGRAEPILLLFIAYWLWMFISALFSPYDTAVAYAEIEATGKILLPFIAGVTLINSLRQLKQLAWVIMLSQAYVAYDLNMSYYSGWNRLFNDGFGGMDNNCIAIAMVTGAGLALFLGIHAQSRLVKGVCALASLLMMHCTMFGFSRGGMLALCLMGLMAFTIIPKRTVHYLIFFAIVAIALRLAGNEVRERFFKTFADQETRDESAQSRLDLWQNALDTMKKSPIVGVGPDQWGFVAPDYGWTEGKKIHSLWLQTGAELGVPGMLLLFAFYATCMARMLPFALSTNPAEDPWIRAMSSAVFVSLFGFIISAQFVSLTKLELPFYIVLLGAGILKLSCLTPVSASDVLGLPVDPVST